MKHQIYLMGSISCFACQSKDLCYIIVLLIDNLKVYINPPNSVYFVTDRTTIKLYKRRCEACLRQKISPNVKESGRIDDIISVCRLRQSAHTGKGDMMVVTIYEDSQKRILMDKRASYINIDMKSTQRACIWI